MIVCPDRVDEWKAAVDLADMQILLSETSLRMEADVPRCKELVSIAAEFGIHPSWTQLDLHRLISKYLEHTREDRKWPTRP